MISERTNLLIQSSSSWSEKKCTNEPNVTLSLSSRLSSLANSADGWKNRVKLGGIDKDISSSCGRSSRRSNQSSIISLDRGLSTFFPPQDQPQNEFKECLDLDVIGPTERLNVIKKTPLARPSKKVIRSIRRETQSEHTIESLGLNLIKPTIEEDIDDEVVPSFDILQDLDEPIARSAREGLAAIEDYTKTKKCLRSTTTTVSSYPSIILIQVKDEDTIDIRAVQPYSCSIHSFASFILLTHSRLFVYNGADSTVLEKSKVVQIASSILHSKQFNCIATKIERVSDGEGKRDFMNILSCTNVHTNCNQSNHQNNLQSKNRFFSIDTNNDIRLESIGSSPKYSMLHPSKCFIFDFHTELYVWCGRDCKKNQSIAAIDYANQMKANSSSFILFEKMSCSIGIAHVLYTSKFIDWPDEHLVTSAPSNPFSYKRDKPKTYKWKPSHIDAESVACYLLNSIDKKDELILEDVSIDGTNKNVMTEDVKLWKLIGDELNEIEMTNIFSNDSCYVLRWKYRIERRVGKLLSCKRDKDYEEETGRERIAYFYWLGSKCHVKEQGKCALRLSQMDKQKCPHIRMEEGSEESIFLSLFNGHFTVINIDCNDLNKMFLIYYRSHNRSSMTQIHPSFPLRSHATYIRISIDDYMNNKDEVVAGSNCNMNDIRAALSNLSQINDSNNKYNYVVEGDDERLKWIESIDINDEMKMYRILASESTLIHPNRYGTTFPYDQSCLEGTILIYCGSNGWLWNDNPINHFNLNVAHIFSVSKKCHISVIEKGNEPDSFKAIFPIWIDYDGQKEFDGGSCQSLEDLLNEISTLSPYDVIRRRNERNELIDLQLIQQNLSDEMFEDIFKVDRSTFYSLPQWRQLQIRKESQFF